MVVTIQSTRSVGGGIETSFGVRGMVRFIPKNGAVRNKNGSV
jgi:hypothetical protein